MAQVTTQAQLAAAIGVSDPDIQIAAGFGINPRQNITLDGARESHAQAGGSLVKVANGTYPDGHHK